MRVNCSAQVGHLGSSTADEGHKHLEKVISLTLSSILPGINMEEESLMISEGKATRIVKVIWNLTADIYILLAHRW